MTLVEKELHVGRGSRGVICPKCGRPGVMRIHCARGRRAVLVVAHNLARHVVAARAIGSNYVNTKYRMICPRCGQEGPLRFKFTDDGVARVWVAHGRTRHILLQRRCR
jgi:predicted RNA-binding Zn-ribbon protein involved in translation (DUF1610 family)